TAQAAYGTPVFTYSDSEDGVYTSTVPSTAGTWWVKAEVAATTNFAAITAKTSFVIAKSQLTEPTVTGTYTYTGEAQTATLDANFDEPTMSILSGGTGKAAGTYTLVITIDEDNYEWAAGEDGNLSWSIAKAQAEITVDDTPITAIYGSGMTIPDATSNFGTVVCDKEASDLIHVGAYTITYTVAETNNYLGDTATVGVTINKKTIEVVANPVVIVQGDADVALTYTLSIDALEAGDEMSGALTRAAGTAPGVYAISLGTLTAGDDYTIRYIGATYTIKAKTLTQNGGNVDGNVEIGNGVNPDTVFQINTISSFNVSVGLPNAKEIKQAYTAGMYLDGVLQNAQGSFTVRFAAPSGLNDGTVCNIILEDGNSLEATVQDGTLSFTTDELGDFAVVADKPPLPSNAKTAIVLSVSIGLAFITLLAIYLIIRKRRLL
ncbi:MAG: MBG domain-containing protein, partial [Clostridia bacterium]|nr:MBG domain-containing protein [Clostridia bacterium]